jgi:NADH dehydrogenase
MRIVIIGAGYAGVTCALRLARKAKGRARITLVDASPRFVERIRLHQQIAGALPPEHDLRHLLRGTGVELEVARATRIDPVARVVEAGDKRLAYDRLVLALGSRTDVDSVPGVRGHAYTLDADHARRLTGALATLAVTGGNVVVVGAGLTGIETVAELAEAYPSLSITLVGQHAPGAGWSAAGMAHFAEVLARLRVDVRTGVHVQEIRTRSVVTDRGELAADVCIWTAGFVAPSLARDAGLAVNERGQVLVDPALRSISHPDIYTAGDITAPVLPPGDPLPMGCKAAGPTGAHVADNLVRVLDGVPEQPFDYKVQLYCVSLGRADGLIQFGTATSLTGKVWTGRRAAWFKEFICRLTVWVLALERAGFHVTKWGQTGHPPRIDAVPAKERAA